MKKIATPLAVIDVGSNSLRLVVYNQAIYPFKILFQKREFLRLGENLDQRNRIISTKIRKAQIVLEKFISEAANYSVSHTYILATAAIRESKNGKEIFQKIPKYKSISSNIISSLQEAKYAAYGVISSLDKPKGVVADLGGGSLELLKIV
jgi:Exopolyphosphatase